MQNKVSCVHPGEVLEEEMRVRGLSAEFLGQSLGVTASRIESIVDGTKRVTPETARLLSQFFDTSPDFWLRLQQTCDHSKSQATYIRET